MTKTALRAKTLLLHAHNIDARRKKMNKKFLNVCRVVTRVSVSMNPCTLADVV